MTLLSRFYIGLFGVLLYGMVSSCPVYAATNFFICKNNSTGAIAVRNKCKRGESKINNISALKGDSGAPGATGPSGATGLTGPSSLLAAAYVDQTGSLNSSAKGTTVTSVTSADVSETVYPGQPYKAFELDINGTFSGLSAGNSAENRAKIIPLCSGHSDNFEVANCYTESASSTNIKIRFFTWKSSNTTATPAPTGRGGFVAAFLGD